MSFSRGARTLTWLHGRASPPGAAHFGTILPRSVRFCLLLRFPPTKEAAAAAFPPPRGRKRRRGDAREARPPARPPDRPTGRPGIRCVALCLGSAARASFVRSGPNRGPTAGAQPAPRLPGRETVLYRRAPVPRPRTGARITNSFARQSAGRDLYPLQPPPPPDHQCLGTLRRRLVLQPTPHAG